MIRFSAGRATSLGVLLAIVLALSWYARLAPSHDECPSVGAMLDVARLDPRLRIISKGRKATQIEAGRLLAELPGAGDGTGPMLVAIQRSFGLSNRLLQPAAALPGRREPDDVESKILSTPHGDLPIHYAYERRGRSTRVTAYFMTYRLQGIRSALWTRVRHGPASVFGGSWPIRLVAIAGRAHPAKLERKLERMDAWLLGAWAHYRAVCEPASASTASDSNAS